MAYSNKVKGLLTEVFPANAGEETLLDCQDVVLSQDSKLESRHGLNIKNQILLSDYSVTNADISIFKIDFSSAFATSSGFPRKYVILNGSTNVMTEIITTDNLVSATTSNTSTLPITYTGKPLGFTFDQSFYIVGSEGWQEMEKDVLDSDDTGVKKVITWPSFVDFNIETFQDVNDFSANWFDINKKVGIRYSYVWNTRYTDETPREVESEPSQIYEVLHPMALYTLSSTGLTTNGVVKDKSRIRIRIGNNLALSPFNNFVENNTNGRKFSIRIYRTKQVNINEALPTEYFVAFPDIEVGKTSRIDFSPSAVDVTDNSIDFSANSVNWKNGDLVRYTTTGSTVGGLVSGQVYYIGSLATTSYKIYDSSLTQSNNRDLGPQGSGLHTFTRCYEADLAVNDDGIISLPQLYTNPNVDGEVNSNALPPVANSVVEYKNYHVAANIREPLRAYITLVNPPLVKNALFIKTIPTATSGNYTFTSFSADTANGYNLDGLNQSSNGYFIDSIMFNGPLTSYPSTVTGSAVVSSTASRTIEFSPALTSQAILRFDGNLVQADATITFRLNGSTTISASVYPEYNRSSLYSKTTDTALEYLQYSGSKKVTLPSLNTVSLPIEISQGGTPYETRTDISLNLGTGRGKSNAGDILSDGTGTASFASGDLTVNVGSTGVLNAGNFQEPGIILYDTVSSGGGLFFYKTYEITNAQTIVFKDVTFTNPTAPSTRLSGYYIEGSNVNNLPLYLLNSTVFAGNLEYAEPDGILNSATFVLQPGQSFYNQPIGVINGSLIIDGLPSHITNPIFLGTLARSPAQLLDLAVSNLVDSLNAAAGTNLVKFVKTEEVGQFYVEYYGGTTLEAQIAGGNHTYEPAITRSTTSWTTIAEYKQNNNRAVSISRYNTPESFPNQSILAPILVGSDKKAIVALAKNANDCFILKEDGIWRLSISGNSSLANVDQVTQIDTTTYCQAPYSVQEINEEIIFLSQKGFISISGNEISAIGRQIETEVKEKLQRSISKGLAPQIRSWVNEEKRIYGCTIPDTTSTFTTYVFNTYTREWTKFAAPVLDAVTDEQGRTLYCIAEYTRTLDATGTLQEQIVNSSTGLVSKFLPTEEIHTDGQSRNEVDQYDYQYKPFSIVDNGNGTVTFTDPSGKSPWSSLGGSTSDITNSGLSFFADRTPYYQLSGVLYPVLFVSRTATTVTISFPDGVPAGITTIGDTDGLYAGIPSSVTFNPSSVGTPDTNKQFSEYMIHTEEAVKSLNMRFKTDSQANFSATRTFAFNTVAVNRTVYRTYIPTSACRGRWFIRQVNHDVPLERLIMTAQTLLIRETGSSKIQKSPR